MALMPMKDSSKGFGLQKLTWNPVSSIALIVYASSKFDYQNQISIPRYERLYSLVKLIHEIWEMKLIRGEHEREFLYCACRNQHFY